jgi:hypothetical protein
MVGPRGGGGTAMIGDNDEADAVAARLVADVRARAPPRTSCGLGCPPAGNHRPVQAFVRAAGSRSLPLLAWDSAARASRSASAS